MRVSAWLSVCCWKCRGGWRRETITVFLNQLQYVKCGLTNSAIGFIYIGVTLAGFLGGISAWLTKKAGVKRLGMLLFVSCIGACLCLSFTRSAWLSVAAILVLRISFSIFQPLQTELQNVQIISQDRASALSMNAVLMDSAAIFTNLLYGAAARSSLSMAMLLGAVLCSAGLFLFLDWHRYFRTLGRKQQG